MVTGNWVDLFAKMGDSVENVMKMSRPRYIKSHLPFEFLPQQIHTKKPKVLIKLFILLRLRKNKSILKKLI